MDDSDIWGQPESSTTASSSKPDSSPSASRANGSNAGQPASQSLFDDDMGADWGAPTLNASQHDPQAATELEVGGKSHDLAQRGSFEQQDRLAGPPQDAGFESAQTSPQPDKDPSLKDRAEQDEDGFDDAAEEQSIAAADKENDDFADFDDQPQTTAAGATGTASKSDGGGEDDFGDFGDFDELSMHGEGGVVDDDFGPPAADAGFGDFDDAEAAAPVVEKPQESDTAGDWQPLAFDQAGLSIADQIRELLSPPLYAGGPSEPYGAGLASELGTEPIRQVEGPSQVLVGESSRQIYSGLSKQSSLQPVDWLRSRTRKDLHISLGVPINLDEIMPGHTSGSGSGSKLPPLALNLGSNGDAEGRPSSAPPSEGTSGRRQLLLAGSAGTSSGGPSRSSSMRSNSNRGDSFEASRKQKIMEKRMEDLGLGPKPEVDLKRVDEVCGLTEDQISLIPLPGLRALSAELTSLTESTSALLTHSLALRESLQADSEMYNGLIKDLVRGATSTLGKDSSNKRYTSSGASGHSATVKRFGGGSGSGSSTPRAASPFGRPPTGSAGAAVRR
ncbi:unnamed protein product [Jaminaea pallidilutea]